MSKYEFAGQVTSHFAVSPRQLAPRSQPARPGHLTAPPRAVSGHAIARVRPSLFGSHPVMHGARPRQPCAHAVRESGKIAHAESRRHIPPVAIGATSRTDRAHAPRHPPPCDPTSHRSTHTRPGRTMNHQTMNHRGHRVEKENGRTGVGENGSDGYHTLGVSTRTASCLVLLSCSGLDLGALGGSKPDFHERTHHAQVAQPTTARHGLRRTRHE